MSIFFKKNAFIILLFLLFPFLALGVEAISGSGAKLGAIPSTPSDFQSIICIIVYLALDFIPFIVALAVIAFLVGLIKYISHGDNAEKRAEGNKMMIYGILGFFFMVSVWGILYIFTNSFKLPLGIPQFRETLPEGKVKGCVRSY